MEQFKKVVLWRWLNMEIKAVVFDLDDTLYNQKDYIYSGLTVLDNWVKSKFKVNGFYDQAKRLFETGEKDFIFNKTLELMNIPFDEKLIQGMKKQYESHIPQISLLDDAKWILSNLANDIKIGIISDGDIEIQANKVRVLRLNERFHSVILSDRFGRNHWKPSPIPYKHVCMAMNVSHQECVYIGSDILKDFITAKRLGWKTVHINRRNPVYSSITVSEEYMAHYQIDNLKKLSTISEFQHLFIRKAEVIHS